MTFERIKDNDSMTLVIHGMIDATTASETEKEITECADETNDLYLDLKDVEYISSAGLRVILNTVISMKKKGNLTLLHVNDEIMDIFDVTGFLDMVTIKNE